MTPWDDEPLADLPPWMERIVLAGAVLWCAVAAFTVIWGGSSLGW